METRSIAVLTQFNLEPPVHWGVRRRCLETDWLVHRIDLLERTSLPSLQSQTLKDFYWIIFIHPDSPGWLKQTLSYDRSDGILRRLVEVDGFDGIDYGSLIKAVLPAREWLTIKLDSDDLLAKEYLEKANSHHSTGVYCFEDGAYLDVQSMRAYRRHYPSNPFPFRISLEGQSALDEGHHVVKIDHRIRTAVPMWIQFHHGDNVSPDWKPLQNLRTSCVQANFNFPEMAKIQEPPRDRLKRFVEFQLRFCERGIAAISDQIRRVNRKLKRILGVARR